MQLRKILVVYKLSSFQAHALNRRDPNYLRLLREKSIATRSSIPIHREHIETLKTVETTLKNLHLSYDLLPRRRLKLLKGYDLVITVGGDGTFLETSHYLGEGLILGVNSAPQHSVGFYCRANRHNFRQKIIQLLKGGHRLQKLFRLELKLKGKKRLPLVLNDVLYTSSNPAGTTRYLLSIGNRQEEQKSSGIWISPAPGSTAAIRSAGGKALPIGSRRFQFVVREPYQPRVGKCRLLKGVLDEGQKVSILSMIDEGFLYVDGPHIAFRVKRGDLFSVRPSGQPLKVIW